MAAPLYTVANYVAAMQALLPRGRVWPRDPDAVQTAVITGLAGSSAASNLAANNLLVGAFPGTALALLNEWELSLGLPGIYGVTPSTTLGRQQAIVAALTDTGGQSIPYFIALAAGLGFTITITQFRPYNVNMSVISPLNSDEWAHVWQVNASASIAVTYTPTVDIVQATPNFGNPLLESVLAKFKPAHTICITSYT